MNEQKKGKAGLALGAMVVGVAAVPVAAFFSTIAGLAMMAAPIFMIYHAS